CAIVTRNGDDTQIFKLNSTATLKWNLNGVLDDSLATLYSVYYNQNKNVFLRTSDTSNNLTKSLTVEKNDPFNGRVSGTITLNNGTGVLSVELKNVEYEDSGNFTFEFVSTVLDSLPTQEKVDITLDVQSGPSKCGDQDLSKNFTCSKGDEISGSVTLCGKPRPNLSWTIGDQSINGTIDSTKTDQHQYTYSFKHNVTSKMCGESVSYRATGFKDNEVGSEALVVMGSYDITAPVFIQDRPCPVFTWDSDNHGLCEVDLLLSFPQNDNNFRNLTTNASAGSFRDCCFTAYATSVEYKTMVYLKTKDGNRFEISDINKPLTTVGLTKTTTTTTTTTATSTKNLQTMLIIGAYFGGIATVLLVLLVIFIVYRYSKQRNKDV
uniref:Ig-like domain-containing protein n=1 Tax=Clytia hemisphaerica TaxID=252671 RepID=A0A7M5V1I9_9CNID